MSPDRTAETNDPCPKGVTASTSAGDFGWSVGVDEVVVEGLLQCIELGGLPGHANATPPDMRDALALLSRQAHDFSRDEVQAGNAGGLLTGGAQELHTEAHPGNLAAAREVVSQDTVKAALADSIHGRAEGPNAGKDEELGWPVQGPVVDRSNITEACLGKSP